MKKRTDIDFKGHQIIITDNEHVKIHHLKLPGSWYNSVKFINCGGVMAVTGDFGNWIFCREFIPSAKGSADEQYMTEKLKIASSQNPYEFDSDATKAEIKRMIDSGEYVEETEKQYLNKLLELADGHEEEYRHWAFSNAEIHLECIPNEKCLKYWLKAIYDAYDAICRRLAEQEGVNTNS